MGSESADSDPELNIETLRTLENALLEFAGNFANYEEDKKRRLGGKAASLPKRITYKKFG